MPRLIARAGEVQEKLSGLPAEDADRDPVRRVAEPGGLSVDQ
ncbi:hypothetical protein F4561_005623 [Lipingzhangella halophila]|uniref:Uncharacterized protein n=1 Tax=Lipingzhangella halophila TaxID=1783352 RepID=A0A7W7RMJ5_9ACTN|nr:hypothetical protein [Lipingzhangella halophila]MBB4934729.1 hypothetical protein [Lipingzhangella halophila]